MTTFATNLHQMLGSIVNATTILIGGALGASFGTGIKEKYKSALFNALGLACLVLGMNAVIPNMPKSEYPVLFIASLAIGGIIGTGLDLQGRIDNANEKLKKRTGSTNNPLLGLVTAWLLFAIGTFSIIGPLLSSLSPSQGWDFREPANTYLYTNATLDCVTSAVMAASYGRILLLAAPLLFCWQSIFYCIGYFFGNAIPEPMIVEISIVGGVLILSSGLSILGIKDCKTINMLPSLLIPVIFYVIKGIIV